MTRPQLNRKSCCYQQLFVQLSCCPSLPAVIGNRRKTFMNNNDPDYRTANYGIRVVTKRTQVDVGTIALLILALILAVIVIVVTGIIAWLLYVGVDISPLIELLA
jgi:hypothetical protein